MVDTKHGTKHFTTNDQTRPKVVKCLVELVRLDPLSSTRKLLLEGVSRLLWIRLLAVCLVYLHRSRIFRVLTMQLKLISYIDD